MQAIIFILTFLVGVISLKVSATPDCQTLYEYSELSISSGFNDNNRQKCIQLKNLVSKKTLFSFHPSYENSEIINNKTYRVTVKNYNSQTIINSEVANTGLYKAIELNGHTELKLFISPEKGAYGNNFNFNIINVKEYQDISIVMIGVSVKPAPTLPTPPPCKNGICTEPKYKSINLTFMQSLERLQTSSSQVEATQCNDSNRPPNAPPINKLSNKPFNYNRTFQMAEAEYASWESQFTKPIAEVIVFWTMYQRHKNDAPYDIKSSRSPYQGNADDGNFLYGGLMAAFGFSKSETQRYSAAYQAIQDNGIAGFPLSIYNFITNTGDNLSDDEVVIRGWLYKKEVHNNNRSDLDKPAS